jgi:superfamily II DNA or RNA helicase
MTTAVADLIGKRVRVPGHFAGVVRLEAADPLGDDFFELRVRTAAGGLDETQLARADLENGAIELVDEQPALVPGDDFFDFVEAHRIELAFAHDPNFAVSMSGVRGLPHQIVAVYRHMLPQARLRFVLADDPGAGKTIMAGLLYKELRLRGVADRVLIVCPAPLTFQWRQELADKFDEEFDILSSDRVKWDLGDEAWRRTDRAITSIDFAKRDEVRAGLERADWDLVIVDEAHKCSAVSRWDPTEEREKIDKTRRYGLVEHLSGRTERLLLMTATPHSGDPSRFFNFLRLLDPDQFSENELAAQQIGRDDSPYFLRRQKEDLKDEHGADLFVPREVSLQPFSLSQPELELYHAVTDYIQEFLGAQGGKRGNAVALARTVLQRRLASSLGAIRSSLEKRAGRIREKIAAVEAVPPAERAAKLAEVGVLDLDLDSEQGFEDATEEEQEAAASGLVVAETLDGMRVEVQALEQLTVHAERTIDSGEERKLGALRDCLERSELRELEDGRGRLLIFTEHRDTLDYLERNLRAWGYSTCTIHGGHPPEARRQIQQEFHQSRQICIATEAAGEGINLQFCHLMINYDLPWNPVRLEQRMGRIHRIGQDSKCVIFNFCAENTVEGKLLARLHEKLEEMRTALGGRVYDVIGELLARNEVNFEQLLREAMLHPERVDQSEREIQAMSAESLKQHEKDLGVAQATEKHVDVSWVHERDLRSEERRLMPEYVEQFFGRACRRLEVRLERRADGMWRIEHVPASLRSPDRLESVRRLGRPQPEYRKLTFKKEDRARAEHEDAVLLSPGHPLYKATGEALLHKLSAVEGAAAPFVAPWATEPYAIHFFSYLVRGLSMSGEAEDVYAELVAVTEGEKGLELVAADVLHDLTPFDAAPAGLDPPSPEEVKRASDFVKLRVQHAEAEEKRVERRGQADIRTEYLEESMSAHRRRLEGRFAELDDRVWRGEENLRLVRDDAERRLDDLARKREQKLAGFEQLGVVRPGPVRYLGTALVGPPYALGDDEREAMRSDPEVELAAMRWAMNEERDAGWDPDDVSAARDGSGFDIRSKRRDASGRVVEVRRIEVKGRGPAQGDVSLCRTEWIAAHRHGDSFWLYVLYGATSGSPRGLKVCDPARALGDRVKKVTTVTAYHVPGQAIEEVGG